MAMGYKWTLYRVLRPPPTGINTPCSARSCKSRVAVAFDAPVMDIYFLALIPPSNPVGPSSSIRRKICNWRSFSRSLNRSKSLVFFSVNSIDRKSVV